VDGVLVVDKPEGLTSHDVVAVARRALGERRIGHTGTLDPLATGVLPLAIGRATRLVRFLIASDKDYEAVIRFGLTTDSYDVSGIATARSDRVPDRDALLAALRSLTGEYLQTPPAFSAKKVGGIRAYRVARAERASGGATDASAAVALTPVPVTVTRAELTMFSGATACVAVTCSAGFYVRSFAHSLGELVGTGACLEALRRTRSGEFRLAQAVSVDELQRQAATAAARVVGIDRLLTNAPAVYLDAEGRRRVAHGQEIAALAGPGEWVRLIDTDGSLVAMATAGSRPGFLHPAVVLI
jgi:tRNA pseudouridine55 synthase